MQKELNAQDPAPPIQLIGVNGIEHSSANDYITKERDLPWLQDTDEVDLWTRWGIQYRDVVILDGDNTPVVIMNLTTKSLSVPENYAELRELLLGATTEDVSSMD